MNKETNTKKWIIPIILAAVLISVIAAVVMILFGHGLNTAKPTTSHEETTAATEPTVDPMAEIEPVVSNCAASIVKISVSQEIIGAGFIISNDGLIFTNSHLVESAESITVTFHDGTSKKATLLDRDANNDIALLQVAVKELKPVKFSSDSIRAEDIVFAFGFPADAQTASASAGFVLNPNQNVKLTSGDNIELVMTDCAIDKSFSGGVLFNLKGEAIGIVNTNYPNNASEDFCISHALELSKIRTVIDDMLYYRDSLDDFGNNADNFDEDSFDPDANTGTGSSAGTDSSIRFGTKLSWDLINSIPIATNSMTEDQLRQICLDYMRLQLTFTWQPSKNFTHSGKLFGVAGTYGGLPYVSSSFGNLYKVMEYYDPITGILDLTDGGFAFKAFGNQCSAATFWSWNRVCNTLKYGGTSNTILKNGCIRVGKYTYDDSMNSYDQKSTNDICKDNGEQVMYESYALLKPADGIVCFQNNAGHLRMISAKPIVVRNPDGTIDGWNSTVVYMDQIKSWSESMQANGQSYEIQGGLDVAISFYALYRDGYLPFTIAELNKQNSVEKGTASINFKEKNISTEQLAAAKITGNYAISTIRIVVKNAQGAELYNKNKIATGCLYYSYDMKSFVEKDNLKKLAGSGNTIQVLTRIGNGEEVVAYTGTLVS